MTDRTASFGINFAVEGGDGVDSTAASLEDLAAQIKADKSALGEMNKALRDLRAASGDSSGSVQELKDQISIHKMVVGDAQAQYLKLGGAFDVAGRAAQRQAAAVQNATTAQGAASSGATSDAADAAAAAARLQSAIAASSATAAASASDLATMAAGLAAGTESVQTLETALKAVGPATDATAGTVGRLTAELTAQRDALRANTAKFLDAGGSIAEVKEAQKGLNPEIRAGALRLADLGREISGTSGVVGVFGSRLGSLGTALASSRVLVAGLIAGLIALGAAFGVAAAKAAQYGIAMAGVKRDQALAVEGLVASHGILHRFGLGMLVGAGSADALNKAISNVTATSNTGQSQVQDYATALYKAHLRGGQLETALKAVTTVSEASGAAAAATALKVVSSYGRMGLGVDSFAQRVESQLGGVAAKRALSLSNQIAKLKDNVSNLFSHLDLSGFLRGFATVTSLFREGASVFNAVKHLFGVLFQPMVDGAGGALPVVRRLIQHVTIAALKLYSQWLTVKSAFSSAVEAAPMLKVLSNLLSLKSVVVVLGSTFAGGFLIGAKIATAALATLGSAAVTAALPFLPMIALVGAVAIAATWLHSEWDSLSTLLADVEWGATLQAMLSDVGGAVGTSLRVALNAARSFWDDLKFAVSAGLASLADIDWAQTGADMVRGIISGISSMGGALKSAIVGMASSALSAFNAEAEIQSPSRKFARAGGFIGQGAVLGIRASYGDVRRATRGLIAAGTPAAPQLRATVRTTVQSGGGLAPPFRRPRRPFRALPPRLRPPATRPLAGASASASASASTSTASQLAPLSRGARLARGPLSPLRVTLTPPPSRAPSRRRDGDTDGPKVPPPAAIPLAPPPPARGDSRPRGGTVVNLGPVSFHFGGGGSDEHAQQAAADSMIDKLTQKLEAAVLQGGAG